MFIPFLKTQEGSIKIRNMNLLVKKVLVTILVVVSFSFSANAQKAKKKADNDTEYWRYEIECVSTGIEGTYLIKVWSYSKKPDVAIEQAKKNAVHGIVFQGYAGGAQGCSSQKPLSRNPNLEIEQKDFFKEFFADGGKYMKYVSLSTDGSVASGDRLKVSKKEYKIGVIVSVRKDELRKDLETAGVIRGLTAGF